MLQNKTRIEDGDDHAFKWLLELVQNKPLVKANHFQGERSLPRSVTSFHWFLHLGKWNDGDQCTVHDPEQEMILFR